MIGTDGDEALCSAEDESAFASAIHEWERECPIDIRDKFNAIDWRDRLRLLRGARITARRYHRHGVRNRDALIANVSREMGKKYDSILVVIGLAALAATIRFWATKLWERWFPDED